MGVVPQEIALYQELSARENLIFWGRLAGLPAKDSKQRSQELLETLALTDRAKEPVKSFSGGMMRRVNIGCALMHRPKLLVLDEPTVGIDPQAKLNILDFINGLKKDGTSILYTWLSRLCYFLFALDLARDSRFPSWGGHPRMEMGR
jgi:ABC-2 type transport system ATP-binding protein